MHAEWVPEADIMNSSKHTSHGKAKVQRFLAKSEDEDDYQAGDPLFPPEYEEVLRSLFFFSFPSYAFFELGVSI